MKNKTTITKFILALFFCAFVTGCGDSNVDKVRAGTINDFPQGTVGDVFEANFTSIDWESEEKDGKTFVLFTAEIDQELHDKAVKALGEDGLKRCIHVDPDFQAQFKQHQKAYESDLQTEIDKRFAAVINSNPELKALKLKTQSGNQTTRDQAVMTMEFKKEDLQSDIIANQSFKAFHQKLIENKKSKQKALEESFKKKVWEEGGQVNFKWLIHPNSDNFELVSYKNDSWKKQGVHLHEVYQVLFVN